jgi:hypothetical protein
MSRAEDLPFVNTMDFFPLGNDPATAQQWYHNLPGDKHFNDQGAEMFARVIHGRIVDHVADGIP